MKFGRKYLFKNSHLFNCRMFYLFLFISVCFCSNGQVYFYKQEKVIDTNTKQSSKGDMSGQYITFNENGCYDSDNQGYSVNNGFLSYVFENKKFATYQGESYWGSCQYRVSLDKSRINIVLDDKVLVYVRTQFPTGQLTSSLIKRKNKGGGESVVPDIINPIGYGENQNNRNNVVDAARYINRYRELEQQLISAFKTYEVSLAGSYDSSRTQAAIAIHGMQRNMADWRRQASQAGVNIPMSSWETAQPSISTIHYEEKKSY